MSDYWPTFESAAEDPFFHQLRGIMGTENYGQDDNLRRVVNMVITMIVPLQSFNKLTPTETERLAVLTEEMGESLQAVGKVLRHGYLATDGLTGKQYDNRQDLAIELGQVEHAIHLLTVNEDLSAQEVATARLDRADAIKPYLHHQ